MPRNSGFTLLEMLTALTLLALLAAMAYAAVQPAALGFRALQAQRDDLQRAYMLARRLRLDTTYFSPSLDASQTPMRIVHDMRAGQAHDTLQLLVRGMAQPQLSLVTYYLDEDTGELVRATHNPWARADSPPVRWRLGPASAFEVEAMDAEGRWRQSWSRESAEGWPRALRVRWINPKGRHELILPLFAAKVS